MNEKSQWEIERWERIIAKCGERGIERLRSYIAGRVLSREFMETADTFYERIGWTEFLAWASTVGQK